MKAKKCIALLLAASLTASLFSACGAANNDSSSSESESSGSSAASGSTGTAEDGGDPAFQKFDEVVEVHIGQAVSTTDSLPEGLSVENNQYTDYLLENFNIKVVVD